MGRFLPKPPADANPNNDVDDARAQIFSDPYFNLGQTSGWIGLLDTGVRTSHVLFNAPDHIAIASDLTGDGDPTDQCGHVCARIDASVRPPNAMSTNEPAVMACA